MLLDALFRSEPLENPATPITSESAETDNVFARDVFVSPETAMKLAAVYACIYVISSNIAQMPLHVMRKTNKKVEAARDHPVFYLVHDEPNMWQTSYKWRELKQRHILGWGNGYTWVKRSRRGEVSGLECCMPWETTLLNTGGRYTYGVYNEEGAFAVNPDDMVHIRALGNNQKMGLSPIMQHAETIGMGMSGQAYTSSFFNGNARPAGIISVKNQLNEESWGRLKSMWQKATAALRSQENKTMLLPAELDYKALTVSPVDAQIIDMSKLNRSMIAGIFNVPAHMINDLEKATFSNITQQAIQFVRYTIMPWVTNWEQELNRRLFTRAELAAGYYVRFNLTGLLRGTPQERAQFYHFAITDGWMSRNEARAFEDMNPVDGLDEMLVSVNAANPAGDFKAPKTDEEKPMNDRETRCYSGEVRAEQRTDEPTRILGYGSVFNSRSEPLWGFREIIKPGAFDDVLNDDVRGLFNHDPNFILGRSAAGTLSLSVDERGLRYDITAPDTQTIRDLVLAPMMRGDINQSSFAFRVSHDGENWYQDDEGIVIREISKFSRLFDVSPVTYPAYQEADSGVRSMKAWQEARDSGALKNAINQRMARERLLTLLNA